MSSQKNKKKLKQLQLSERRKARFEYATQGNGVYIYRNNTKGTLKLPKPANNGAKYVEAGQTWVGDSYFMQLVEKCEARLVEILENPSDPDFQACEPQEVLTISESTEEETSLPVEVQLNVNVNLNQIEPEEKLQNEENIMEEKLILDQPEMVTTEGTVEFVADGELITEIDQDGDDVEMDGEKLLTEDPLSGIEIITG